MSNFIESQMNLWVQVVFLLAARIGYGFCMFLKKEWEITSASFYSSQIYGTATTKSLKSAQIWIFSSSEQL